MTTIRRIRRAPAPSSDRGAAMVEFALVLLPLLILTLGIINFGYLFGQKLALNQAVREGARAAVVEDDLGRVDPASYDAAVEERVRDAVGGLLPRESVKVSVEGPRCGGPETTRESLTVVASADDIQLLVPMPIPGFRTSFPLTAEAVFRCEF